MKTRMLKILLTMVLLLWPISASALPVTFSDPFGSHATFDTISGNQLQVTLWTDRNSTKNSEVLTALFFDISGISSLTPLSATVPVNSATGGGNTNSFLYLGANNYAFSTALDVGGEWAYKSGLSLPGRGTQGIGTAGLDGTFGAGDLFPGTDLNDRQAPDGGDFGLVGLASTQWSGEGYDVVVKNTTIFVLPFSGTLTGVQNVSFQYGTSLTEVPEPSTLLLLGSGLIGLGILGRKRFHRV